MDALVWEQEICDTREIAISIDGIVLLYMYTPTQCPKREIIFSRLLRWHLPRFNAVELGDFNCAQSHMLNRLVRLRYCRPECPVLKVFLVQNECADARVTREHADDEEADGSVDHFTYR